jgi:uncharacterized membrane protein
MKLFEWMRILHIMGGFTALLTFWIPVVTKKGGTLHVRSGWVYVIGMVIVAITAVYMVIYRIIDPTTSPVLVSFSLFLLYISILSSSTALLWNSCVTI